MSAWFVTVLVLLGSVCEINGAALCNDAMSQQWSDFVATFDDKIAKLETMLTEKDDRISLLEKRLDIEIEKKNMEITQLKRDMAMLKTEGEDVEEMEFNVNNENNPAVIIPENYTVLKDLQRDSTTQRDDDSTSRYEGQKKEVDRVDKSRRGGEREILNRYRRVALTPTVAFHTKMSSPKTSVNGITMIYDEVALDQGNGYNPRNGIYTAPVSGTYVFTWKVLSSVHSIIRTSLVVNGEVMGTSDTDSQDITDYHQATAIVVLRLNQGDLVLVKLTDTNLGGMVSDAYHGKATFSGWKI